MNPRPPISITSLLVAYFKHTPFAPCPSRSTGQRAETDFTSIVLVVSLSLSSYCPVLLLCPCPLTLSLSSSSDLILPEAGSNSFRAWSLPSHSPSRRSLPSFPLWSFSVLFWPVLCTVLSFVLPTLGPYSHRFSHLPSSLSWFLPSLLFFYAYFLQIENSPLRVVLYKE